MTDTFDLIAEQRRRVAQCLEGLDDAEWETPSLCRGWTVRHVATHLCMSFVVSTPTIVWKLVKSGGNFNRISNDFARSEPARANQELVGLLRDNATNRFTPPGLGPDAPMTDIVIHGLDVSVPTKRTIEVSAEAYRRVLDFLVSPKASRGFVRPRMTKGLRFSCPELEWHAGEGLLVEGSASDLALALTGRRREEVSLRGDGVDSMRRRATY